MHDDEVGDDARRTRIAIRRRHLPRAREQARARIDGGSMPGPVKAGEESVHGRMMPPSRRERQPLCFKLLASCRQPACCAVASPGRRDLRVVWHPCTQMKDHEWLPMIPIARGSGVWLYDHDGRRYLDAISSWWVNLFGHANPRINAALTRAARPARARHARRVHARARRRTRRTAHAARATRPHALFLRRQRLERDRSRAEDEFPLLAQTGRTSKRRFVTLANSYHGETLGALAVGNVELYKEIYQPLLMDVITVPIPDCVRRVSPANRARLRAPRISRRWSARSATRR